MKISVALCTYNGQSFIEEQINSILNQTLKVDEIIVCDDGSSDKTIKILNQYSKDNPQIFKIYQNEQNLRSVKNFEKAIQLCTGDIIFLSDQDDIWVKEKVADYIDYFNSNPKIEVLASNGYCVNENGDVIDKYALWDVPEFLKEKNVDVDYFKLITHIENIATGASMALRREIFSEVLPFPIIKNFHHDEWIAIIAAQKNTFELLNNKYFYYRIHNYQQVGGVFYDKTQKNKILLTEIFDLKNKDISFESFKKRLKKLSFASIRNIQMSSNIKNYENYFTDNIKQIEICYNKTKNAMRKKYKLLFFILNITDTILKKRQLKN